MRYASLQTFLNFSIMKKQQKRNKIIHKIISSNISKSSIKKSKRNSPIFWIWPGQTSSWWDIFCASRKVFEKWKENFCMSEESFEIMYWTETLCLFNKATQLFLKQKIRQKFPIYSKLMKILFPLYRIVFTTL